MHFWSTQQDMQETVQGTKKTLSPNNQQFVQYNLDWWQIFT